MRCGATIGLNYLPSPSPPPRLSFGNKHHKICHYPRRIVTYISIAFGVCVRRDSRMLFGHILLVFFSHSEEGRVYKLYFSSFQSPDLRSHDSQISQEVPSMGDCPSNFLQIRGHLTPSPPQVSLCSALTGDIAPRNMVARYAPKIIW
jgi:hypothetical protein